MKTTFSLDNIALERFSDLLKWLKYIPHVNGDISIKEYKYYKFRVIYTIKHKADEFHITSKKVLR